ncbi:hypothetical protein HN592_02475 [Candidatus Woesearchaeota archaeon]|jgi:hypothetical protein|nr:hypothetical protein [Candidatus Woesearchaeota archaeon]MBT4368077.1 hypothetical protein [Candidatus Woesearchaeota archaeon]MBT4712565.1 hypothetical protein [Candidatus Woesearchaeota archaeon]MBT6639478.1 hypothetical protein [Candidatus Woesearchaeota archaeon]MBT7133650.1 hypothetical protein [Candidatus Woesearchaeota archaeon]
MVSVLRESIGALDNIGFLNVLLPFIFVYLIVFALLEKTKVLGIERNGKSKKNLNAMVSFVLGFVFIASTSHVVSLLLYLQILGMALVFVMALLYGFAAFKEDKAFEFKNFIYVVVLIFIIVAFFYAMGFLNNAKWDFVLELIFNPVVITVVCFYLIIMFVTGGGKKKAGTRGATSSKTEKGYVESIGEKKEEVDHAARGSDSSDEESS